MKSTRSIGAILVAIGILIAALSRTIVSVVGNRTVVSASFGGASLNVTQPVDPAAAARWTWALIVVALVICALGIWLWRRGKRETSR